MPRWEKAMSRSILAKLLVSGPGSFGSARGAKHVWRGGALFGIRRGARDLFPASQPEVLEAALTSGGGKEDANLSAKGSAARDVYVRLLKDSALVSEQISRLAHEEFCGKALSSRRTENPGTCCDVRSAQLGTFKADSEQRPRVVVGKAFDVLRSMRDGRRQNPIGVVFNRTPRPGVE